MKITFLGQAGLLFEMAGCTVMVDPYFSDSVRAVNPANWRRQPVDARFFEVRPDVLVLTHDHLDHYDPETTHGILESFPGITVLAPGSVWQKVRQVGGDHNYVQFQRHTHWTEKGVHFYAVKAQHSDEQAIGLILTAEGKRCYITGDTLYSEDVLADLPGELDVVFLPVNGKGNNMNMTDAAEFFRRTGGKLAVPVHTGMFDALDAGEFPVENKVVPEIYKEIVL